MSLKAVNKTAPVDKKDLGSFAKYRSLILISSGFFALVVLLSALTFVASNRLAVATQELEVSAQQTVLVQQLSKNLLDVNLRLVEIQQQAVDTGGLAMPNVTSDTVPIDSLPQSSIYQIEELSAQTERFTNTLNALKNGGEITTETGNKVAIRAVTDPDLVKTLANIESIWTPYLGLLENFDKESDRGLLKKQTSDYLVDYTRLYNVTLQDETAKLTTGLNQLIQQGTDRLRIAQVAGIIVALGLFLSLVFGSLRQLARNDRLLDAARRETADILATVNTGLFLLDKDLNIGQQHSKALSDIIGTERLAGQNLTDVLHNRISDSDLETTRQFVEQLYNTRVKERLVNDLNPLHKVMFYDEDNAKNRYLDFKFSRVYEGKDIARILVNVNDVSNAVYLEQRLEKERAQNDMQIEMLTTILNVSPKIINEFIANTRTHIDKMNNILKNPGSSQFELESKLKYIYREMHSLKGEASALKLHSFTKIASDAEDMLHQLQNQSKLTGNDFLPLTVQLDELLNLSNTITSLGERINQGAMQQPIIPSPTHTSSLDDVVSLQSQDAKAELGGYLVQFGADIAKRQEKKIDVDVSGMAGVQIPPSLSVVVKEICVQLLRNAIVHGIADSETRIKNGKTDTGVVSIYAKENQEQNQKFFTFTVEDDGQGIDYDAIRQKLIDAGKYSVDDVASLSEAQLLNTLFSSGFSTKDTTDEDGGRGVGLDIVKDRVKEYGGKINVQSEKGKFARFTIRLPVPIVS